MCARLGMLLALAVLVPPAAARGLAERDLHRPLHLPRLAAGAPCPVSHVDASVDFGGFGVGKGIGRGPAYPIIPRGAISLVPAATFGSRSWAGQKVLWFVHPRNGGAVLIRGGRVDGAGQVRFGRGAVPATELRIRAGLREQPSFTRVREAGCYAYQVDGAGFSRVVVFRATGSVTA